MFDSYYDEIDQAYSEDEKLVAIVKLCRALEVNHVFPDGNQRTISFCLLNKLLLENGFFLAILEKPCMFDGQYTKKEMVQMVREGIHYAQSLPD